MVKLICMVGISGSGKSYYAKIIAEKENAVILSSDALRIELFNDINNMDNNNKVFKELHTRMKKYLIEGKSVILDSTNLSYKKRMAILDEVKKIDYEKSAYLVACPYEQCLRQNSNRERKVSETVLKRMYESIVIPQLYEGFSNIHIIYNIDSDIEYDSFDLFFAKDGLYNIDQNNSHHTKTIGEHCIKCADIIDNYNSSNIFDKIDNYILFYSALYHDIGKKFTKKFKNSKGEVTTEAHYFNHQFVSAYDSLFFLKDFKQEDLLLIIKYITWHMRIFDLITEKSKNKFIKLVGQDCYDNLLILHEADIRAK